MSHTTSSDTRYSGFGVSMRMLPTLSTGLFLSWMGALMLISPHEVSAQAHPCCLTATCVSCEQVGSCDEDVSITLNEVILPDTAGFGFGVGLLNCGSDHPDGTVCLSWTQNSLALQGADCLEPACVNLDACNYIPGDVELTAWEAFAVGDLSLCTFPNPCENCEGSCVSDVNTNGICDCFEEVGCTDSLACNYEADAGIDNGSCTFPEPGFDCNGTCLDFDSDGICNLDEILGCTDLLAINYHPLFTDDDGSCLYPEDYGVVTDNLCGFDINGDAVIGVGDLIIVLQGFGSPCE